MKMNWLIADWNNPYFMGFLMIVLKHRKIIKKTLA